MAQEFTIKSQDIEDKINQLLPSQGGFQPGVDFSASTMVIPIVDLTETAEGSSLRQDLQRAISFTAANEFAVSNTTTTVINTTGYYQISGTSNVYVNSSTVGRIDLQITDGVTTKNIWSHATNTTTTTPEFESLDFANLVIFLRAGESFQITANSRGVARGSARQIADINGNLVNP